MKVRLRIGDVIEEATAELLRIGFDFAEATAISKCLIASEFVGRESHGLVYVDIYRNFCDRDTISTANIEIIVDGGIIFVNANGRTGHYVLNYLYNFLEERLSNLSADTMNFIISGMAPTTGNIGVWAKVFLQYEMFGIGFFNTSGGLFLSPQSSLVLGTNPMFISAPGKNGGVIYDSSCTLISWSEIYLAKVKGDQLRQNVAVEYSGKMTLDPTLALDGGALPTGGSKGIALSVAIEALAGAVTGAKILGKAAGGWGAFVLLSRTSAVNRVSGGILDRMEDFIIEVNTKNDDATCVRVPGNRRYSTKDIMKLDLSDSIEIDERILSAALPNWRS